MSRGRFFVAIVVLFAIAVAAALLGRFIVVQSEVATAQSRDGCVCRSDGDPWVGKICNASEPPATPELVEFRLLNDADVPARCPHWNVTKTTPPYRICHFGPGDQISRKIMETGVWEPELMRALKTELDVAGPDAAFLDVGANIGTWSLYAAALGHVAFAFEPCAETSHLLWNSVVANGWRDRVFVFQNGLSDAPSVARLLKTEKNMGHSHLAKTGEEVHLVTLDDALPRLRELMSSDGEKIAVVKIDAEGVEPRVLVGGRRFLTRSPPDALFMEFIETYVAKYGCDAGETFAALMRAGYTNMFFMPRRVQAPCLCDAGAVRRWLALDTTLSTRPTRWADVAATKRPL